MQIEQITLLRTPEGLPTESDFALGTSCLETPAEGQALVRVVAPSLDPCLRPALAGRHLSGAVQPGEVVRGEGLVNDGVVQFQRARHGHETLATAHLHLHRRGLVVMEQVAGVDAPRFDKQVQRDFAVRQRRRQVVRGPFAESALYGVHALFNHAELLRLRHAVGVACVVDVVAENARLRSPPIHHVGEVGEVVALVLVGHALLGHDGAVAARQRIHRHRARATPGAAAGDTYRTHLVPHQQALQRRFEEGRRPALAVHQVTARLHDAALMELGAAAAVLDVLQRVGRVGARTPNTRVFGRIGLGHRRPHQRPA